ncbi:MmgE/PrpD family protein [Acuticoccus kandeliae]|uniref:MmgE/PrpD family protein n=1 Tax=Acuticoccus kandeliae TaxID=2073160 RepID=UPI000D3EC264|nr:MmgE/PrpD family protein [Acuticoccus kandeliae]
MSLVHDLFDRLDAVAALPPDVERVAARHLLDVVGVAFAASGSPVGAPWRGHAARVGARGGPASLIGSPLGAAPADAALVNGGLMHSLEFDDTHTGSIVHGSAVLAAATIAAAEAAEAEGRPVTGHALLAAYALWYEVLIRVGLAAAGGFQRRGFQITSLAGTLAAAAIGAGFAGLPREERVAAVGISLSQASGVFEFLSNGSNVKSMHPGWAAHAGLVAAELAASGLRGPLTAIEGRFGLFRAFAGDEEAAGRFAATIGDLGEKWHLRDAAYKLLPCCHYLHPFVEVAGRIAETTPAAAIASVECLAPEGVAPIVCDPWPLKQAAEGHAARWSLPVSVAMRIVDGEVNLASFERPLSDGVADLARRTTWAPLENSGFPQRFAAKLRVTLHDGRVLEGRVDDVYGNASRPASEAALDAKFQSNMARACGPEAAARLSAAVLGLADGANVAPLTAALKEAGRGER